MSLNRL